MLYAVLFPGELAKYDMLHEAIVHKCIKQVSKNYIKIKYMWQCFQIDLVLDTIPIHCTL